MERTSQAPKTSVVSFREKTIYTKMSKCTFDKEEVEYLGHIILEGIKVDSNKIKVIIEWA
jgi:hypothetical protein